MTNRITPDVQLVGCRSCDDGVGCLISDEENIEGISRKNGFTVKLGVKNAQELAIGKCSNWGRLIKVTIKGKWKS